LAATRIVKPLVNNKLAVNSTHNKSDKKTENGLSFPHSCDFCNFMNKGNSTACNEFTIENKLKELYNGTDSNISKPKIGLNPRLVKQINILTNEQLSQLIVVIIKKIEQTAKKGGANKVIGERQWTEVIQTLVEYGNMHILRSFKYCLQMECDSYDNNNKRK
jgi:hypothetical protein